MGIIGRKRKVEMNGERIVGWCIVWRKRGKREKGCRKKENEKKNEEKRNKYVKNKW